ncbi:hypothetical protein [Dyadobacter pollutisoli]|uniref:Uncharacterized protein n=1 Tax=Dyadobacter pollutisoli TaxID=2910158 RepID=A0A9E8N9W1_9BACT|nr:hypothetical protein [Dyadobacter pollutisoli]WAC11443.1 hypothetical protein ON006_27385 [Dyadobacter pollutisoli]
MSFFKAALISLFCLLVSLTFAQPSSKSITAKEAAAETERVISDYKKKIFSSSKADWDKGKIQIGSDSLLLPFQR